MCKVCGEPAAGYHFGAFTCEGCKSFFGRTYNNLSALGECKNNGQCVINKKNRTACKSCRLKKCLMVGMSKSGSRYGRRSNWFKIHCLIQDQADQMNTRIEASPTATGNQSASSPARSSPASSVNSSNTTLPLHPSSKSPSPTELLTNHSTVAAAASFRTQQQQLLNSIHNLQQSKHLFNSTVNNANSFLTSSGSSSNSNASGDRHSNNNNHNNNNNNNSINNNNNNLDIKPSLSSIRSSPAPGSLLDNPLVHGFHSSHLNHNHLTGGAAAAAAAGHFFHPAAAAAAAAATMPPLSPVSPFLNPASRFFFNPTAAAAAVLFKEMVTGLGLNPKLYSSYASVLQQQQAQLQASQSALLGEKDHHSSSTESTVESAVAAAAAANYLLPGSSPPQIDPVTVDLSEQDKPIDLSVKLEPESESEIASSSSSSSGSRKKRLRSV